MQCIEQTIFYKDLFKLSLIENKKAITESIQLFENNEQSRIPKKIHRIWVGPNSQPEIVKKCIDSFDLLNPLGYEQKIWNESNSPIELYKFAREAYKQKKWAFVSDVIRLHAVYYEGGIYLDTDMEILKPFDELLNSDGFCSQESSSLISFGAFGAKRFNPYIKVLLDFYRTASYVDCAYYRTANTRIISKIDKIVLAKRELKKYMSILSRNNFLDDNKMGFTRNYGTGLW